MSTSVGLLATSEWIDSPPASLAAYFDVHNLSPLDLQVRDLDLHLDLPVRDFFGNNAMWGLGLWSFPGTFPI
jgi:hypothetical protein